MVYIYDNNTYSKYKKTLTKFRMYFKSSRPYQSKELRTMSDTESLKRILILRLSSFGDIIQVLPTIDLLQQQQFQIDFYTKPEFKYCVEPHKGIHQVYYFNKKNSLWNEVLEFRKILKTNSYDYVYDAHSNNRTYLLRLFTLDLRCLAVFGQKLKWIRRPKFRLRRLLYFKFKRRSVFPNPLIAAESFLRPLIKNHVLTPTQLLKSLNTEYNHYLENSVTLKKVSNPPQPYTVLAPSAAWPLKRWPTEYFKSLITLKPKHHFVILGGPDDDFAHELQGENVTNLVGQVNWLETGHIIAKSQALIAADTGVLHWSDYMGRPTIGLLGPTAFGQPYRSTTLVLNQNLPCSPCTKDGRGACKIAETQKCLKDIKPINVASQMDKLTYNS